MREEAQIHKRKPSAFGLLIALLVALSSSGCEPAPRVLGCHEGGGELLLPEGFCAIVVADSLGRGRHIAVSDSGQIYVALRYPNEGNGIAALRDDDGDGRADEVVYFGEFAGTGLHLLDRYLYLGHDTLIVRYPVSENYLRPVGPAETIVSGFPDQNGHRSKPFDFDETGSIYVNVGAPSNACQEPTRTPGVAGLDPCPLLDRYGGIWRFASDRLDQTYESDGVRFATGIRNAVAIGWNPFAGKLFVVQHGRDQLAVLWPELYSDSLSAELPAEEMFAVDNGDDFGWPYCYYDHLQNKKVLAPEYGGDGSREGRCVDTENPVAAFPGHWAPNDLVFYDGSQFPERYREGAFIAFHGSWNRGPLEQQGFNVVFVPFKDGIPSGDYEIFADGFAGPGPIMSRDEADYRPTGLAVGPDGSLYIVDSTVGRIWRVMYRPQVGR
jgi:glucose/arabinose dehydrogenase